MVAELASPVADRIAFRGHSGTSPGGGKERVEVGIASEVVNDSSNRTDMKMKPLGDVICGCGFVEVCAADLVVTLGRDIRLLK